MKTDHMTSNRLTLFRFLVLLFLMLTMTVASSAELLVDRCDSVCERECDESCENCGDCVDCQRTMPMLVTEIGDGSDAYYDSAWLLSPTTEKNKDLFCGSIEHPPQLA